MEAASAPATPVAAPAAAGAAMPSAPASPQYTPPPPPMQPMPSTMAEGGSVSSGGGGNKFKEFFSDINLLEVAISAFIIGGVLYSIHYFKFMMMLEKTGYADLNSRIQKLESQMAAAKKSSEANATGNGRMRMPKKRALVTL